MGYNIVTSLWTKKNNSSQTRPYFSRGTHVPSLLAGCLSKPMSPVCVAKFEKLGVPIHGVFSFLLFVASMTMVLWLCPYFLYLLYSVILLHSPIDHIFFPLGRPAFLVGSRAHAILTLISPTLSNQLNMLLPI